MAYQMLGAVNTREVRGAKLVRVREFQVMSLPSETFFQFRRAAGEPCFRNPRPCADNIAKRVEDVLADPLVTDVVYSQDTTPGGRLLDLMTVYYASEDGTVEGAVEIRLVHFSVANVRAAIQSELAEEAVTFPPGEAPGLVE